MLKIISATDRRALDRLLAAEPAADAALARRVAAIVADVRRGGDRAVLAYARRFDRLDGADRSHARARWRCGAREAAPRGAARAHAPPRGTSAASRGRRCRAARG